MGSEFGRRLRPSLPSYGQRVREEGCESHYPCMGSEFGSRLRHSLPLYGQRVREKLRSSKLTTLKWAASSREGGDPRHSPPFYGRRVREKAGILGAHHPSMGGEFGGRLGSSTLTTLLWAASSGGGCDTHQPCMGDEFGRTLCGFEGAMRREPALYRLALKKKDVTLPRRFSGLNASLLPVRKQGRHQVHDPNYYP